MKLRKYVLSEQNIYLAIYAVKSYVFNPQLLKKKDKELLNSLADVFDENIVNKVIQDVKGILKKILDDENYLFKTEVYYEPKNYKDHKRIYRPIHTAELKQLIAMVALLHPLIYEIPTEKDNWKLNLSNYSRLIPNNFYGNRVSKRPEELFKKWNEQYKKYTQKANEYFKTFHESKEYKYELKLDLENFFPSVDPLIIYGILLENMPVTLSDDDDIYIFKKIVYKLLVCKVTNLKTDLAKEYYYGNSKIAIPWTKGIAQGLPQSYFFGNICMIEISKIFDNKFKGKSVYYVDDSYIYTNEDIKGKEDFKKQLEDVNVQIKEKTDSYIEKARKDEFFCGNTKYFDYSNKLCEMKDCEYGINVHTAEKSDYTLIQESKEGEIYLRTLSREASQIGSDITSTYSPEEDEAMLHRTEALLEAIESEKKDGPEKGYKEKLERYYKFFKYREIKLRLKTQKSLNKDIFKVLIDDNNEINYEDGYGVLANGIETETFFKNYKKDIWQVAISLLISNTLCEHEEIRKYIRNVLKVAYPDELLKCSYIKKMYQDYLNKLEVSNTPDSYATLRKQTNRKLIRYANMNANILKEEFTGVRINGLEEEVLSSFKICSDTFVKTSKIVNLNSNRLQRMFLNAVYSKIFKVTLSEDVVLSSYDKKGITYGELRVLVYLRNTNCNIGHFFKWNMDIMGAENAQSVDYTIFEVLGIYKRYVVKPENIDNLIMVHKYTCDVWKNGAKHLYFYTLHNQEHAVDLVKNIVKIVKVFSYIKISSYDYYILFIACYLHDISMVRIASENDFLLDKGDSDKIVTKLDEKWSAAKSTSDTKKTIVETYKAVDSFFENKIRSKHAKDSAEEIRRRNELTFLESNVRESVADISESHMMDVEDIYFLKGDAKKKLISYKFDKILLRFADLLDMSEHRVSKPILNHNIDNMSSISAFHWVSHLLTERYSLTSKYIKNKNGSEVSDLSPGSITEIVTLSIFVNLSQFSKMDPKECKCGKLKEDTLNSNGFEIELLKENEVCSSEKCNFLCRWFNHKNNYLIEEMQALEAYLARVPVTERFYDTKIIVKVVVSNPTDISDEQFEILKKSINK